MRQLRLRGPVTEAIHDDFVTCVACGRALDDKVVPSSLVRDLTPGTVRTGSATPQSGSSPTVSSTRRASVHAGLPPSVNAQENDTPSTSQPSCAGDLKNGPQVKSHTLAQNSQGSLAACEASGGNGSLASDEDDGLALDSTLVLSTEEMEALKLLQTPLG